MMMKNCVSFLFLAAVSTVVVNAYDRYAGYQPTTLITDVAAIDLDQEEFNKQTGERELLNAMKVYEMGGHSGSYAELIIQNATVAVDYPKGTIIHGITSNDDAINGTLLEPVSWKAGASSPVMKVLYDVGPLQIEYSDCQVGGLFTFGAAEKGGCFIGTGHITVEVDGEVHNVFNYKYDIRGNNKNNRTLQRLSTLANITMKGPDGKYYKEYQTFVDYYGDYDYADKWVTSAFRKQNTGFKSKRGDSDFSTLSNRAGQGEAMKKGSAYLNLWMEVIREINEAVADCRSNIPDAEKSVDEAVAYYAGSRSTEEGSEGVLLYALAEIRSHQMKTAGHLDDKDVGDAFVNVQIFRQFKLLQGYLQADDAKLCDLAEESKETIISLMKVPMVQSVIRYAYHQDKEAPESQEDEDKMIAEGATFAATMLPFIHQCNARAAEIVHKNMKLGVIANYDEVRKAMESTYDCLGVTCADVGGVWDSTNQKYKSLPCGVKVEKSTASSVSMFFGIAVGILLAGFVFFRYRHKIPLLHKKRKPMPPMYNTGNIAAVAEIA